MTDDSKRIRRAVEEVFGRYALIRRCQWHKRENVVDSLPKGRKTAFRKLLQRAYEQPTYEGFKRALMRVKRKLSLLNESAIRSLEEGLEETIPSTDWASLRGWE